MLGSIYTCPLVCQVNVQMEYIMVDKYHTDGVIINASNAVKILQAQVKNETELRNMLLLLVCVLYLCYLYLFYRMERQGDQIAELQKTQKEQHPLLEKLLV